MRPRTSLCVSAAVSRCVPISMFSSSSPSRPAASVTLGLPRAASSATRSTALPRCCLAPALLQCSAAAAPLMLGTSSGCPTQSSGYRRRYAGFWTGAGGSAGGTDGTGGAGAVGAAAGANATPGRVVAGGAGATISESRKGGSGGGGYAGGGGAGEATIVPGSQYEGGGGGGGSTYINSSYVNATTTPATSGGVRSANRAVDKIHSARSNGPGEGA